MKYWVGYGRLKPATMRLLDHWKLDPIVGQETDQQRIQSLLSAQGVKFLNQVAIADLKAVFWA